MAWRDKPIEQLYFPIHVVAEQVGVTPSCIRVWEAEFGIQIAKKYKMGLNRSFTKSDIAIFKEIYRLLKVEMYTIKGAKRQLELHPPKETEDLKEDTKALFLDNELQPTSGYSQGVPRE